MDPTRTAAGGHWLHWVVNTLCPSSSWCSGGSRRCLEVDPCPELCSPQSPPCKELCAVVGLCADAIPAGRYFLPSNKKWFQRHCGPECMWQEGNVTHPFQGPPSPESFNLWESSVSSWLAAWSLELGSPSERGNLGEEGSCHPPFWWMLVTGIEAAG